MKSFFSVGLAVIFMALGVTEATANDLIGKPAPAFEVTGVSGTKYTNESLKGKVVVLEWFNNGCPFVERVYKNNQLQGLQHEATQKGVVYLVVNSTRADHRDFLSAGDFEKVKAEWKMENSDYIIDSTGTLGKAFEAKSTPTIAVINKEGVLSYFGAVDNHPKVSGEPEKMEFYGKLAMDAALAGKAAEPASVKAYGCSIKY